MRSLRLRRATALLAALPLALWPGLAPAQPPREVAAPEAMASRDGDVAALRADLVAELARAGLVGRGEPVAAFSWTLEQKRPARSARRIDERFAGTPAGAPAGLSPMVRMVTSPKPRGPRAGVSVRGLMVVRPGDDELEVRVEGLVFPLEAGARFRLSWVDEDGSLSQECVAGALVAASRAHPAIPGGARMVECSGRGRYHGIGVRVGASVLYLVALGVFLTVDERIDSPIGRLRGGNRVLSFAAGPG